MELAGLWTGKWSVNQGTQVVQTGSMTAVIDAKGTLNAWFTNKTLGISGKVSGSLEDIGAVFLDYQYPDSPRMSAVGRWGLGDRGELRAMVQTFAPLGYYLPASFALKRYNGANGKTQSEGR